MLTHILRHIFRMPRPTNYRIPLAPPSEYKPSLCSPQLHPKRRCVEYYDINFNLIAVQGTPLSETSVGLNATVAVR